MTYTHSTTKVGDYTIKVVSDDDSESPREWCNIGKMVCWHRKYSLGDAHSYNNVADYLEGLASDAASDTTERLCERYENDLIGEIDYKEKLWEIVDKFYVALPLYLYDHSGITMNCEGFSCPWDSGQVGYIYVSKKDVLREFGGERLSKTKLKRALEVLKGEVRTYAQYLEGDVWGYTIEKNGVEIDSLYGMYGLDYAKEEMKMVVASLATKAQLN